MSNKVFASALRRLCACDWESLSFSRQRSYCFRAKLIGEPSLPCPRLGSAPDRNILSSTDLSAIISTAAYNRGTLFSPRTFAVNLMFAVVSVLPQFLNDDNKADDSLLNRSITSI